MNTQLKRDPSVDRDWQDLASLWDIRPDTTYLNHGSFGPPSKPVRELRRQHIDALDAQPMDFYLRQFEPLLAQAKNRLAQFLGTTSEQLIFAENATYAMNVVAESYPLSAGDEVIVGNHEYGAVHRIWNRVVDRVGARCVMSRLPDKIESVEQVVDSLVASCTNKTKLLVVSHITSATALILPIAEIVEAMKQRGIAVCVDGPHAPAQIELNIDELGCDFYTASCHKWLNSSLGSGFLYVKSGWHEQIEPTLKSWGRLLPAIPEHWTEEFTWSGTRDPSTYLSIVAAIDLMEKIGFENFRQRSRWLARYGEERLVEAFGHPTMAKREDGWYGSMAHVRLPDGDQSELQTQLWQHYQIEIPVFPFEDINYLRLSCHLYNSKAQIDQLMEALTALL